MIYSSARIFSFPSMLRHGQSLSFTLAFKGGAHIGSTLVFSKHLDLNMEEVLLKKKNHKPSMAVE